MLKKGGGIYKFMRVEVQNSVAKSIIIIILYNRSVCGGKTYTEMFGQVKN